MMGVVASESSEQSFLIHKSAEKMYREILLCMVIDEQTEHRRAEVLGLVNALWEWMRAAAGSAPESTCRLAVLGARPAT